MNGPYDDIIDLPHHVSSVHPRMSMYSRAAQFAPFSALTGHEEAIRETARLTDCLTELTPEEAGILDRRLSMILNSEGERPEATITFFEPDTKKKGGAYRHVTGRIRKADPIGRIVEMDDGTRIPMENITYIDGECF